MNHRPSRSYLLRYLWQALRQGRETVSLAPGELSPPSTYQGRVALDMARCRGCGLCVRACPAGALELTNLDEGGLCMRLYHERCALCGICELACPAEAIHRTADVVAAEADPARLSETWERQGSND